MSCKKTYIHLSHSQAKDMINFYGYISDMSSQTALLFSLVIATLHCMFNW